MGYRWQDGLKVGRVIRQSNEHSVFFPLHVIVIADGQVYSRDPGADNGRIGVCQIPRPDICSLTAEEAARLLQSAPKTYMDAAELQIRHPAIHSELYTWGHIMPATESPGA